MTQSPQLTHVQEETQITANPWQALRAFTDARIALGRSGVSQPTSAQLAFQLAHAQARDAVHLALDVPALQTELLAAGFGASLRLHSAAVDRHQYLQRPDLGRRLDEASRDLLTPHRQEGGYDLALVLADGLSALALKQNALPFLQALRDKLTGESWTLAPLCVMEQGRVAVADEVAQRLGARAVVILVGERPGLSSPDSLGLYFTQGPKVGLTDERRNCISNVRPAGMSYEEAAYRLHYLLSEGRRRNCSGVELKDETASQGQTALGDSNFLLAPPQA